jgi:hypothetical protein
MGEVLLENFKKRIPDGVKSVRDFVLTLFTNDANGAERCVIDKENFSIGYDRIYLNIPNQMGVLKFRLFFVPGELPCFRHEHFASYEDISLLEPVLEQINNDQEMLKLAKESYKKLKNRA